MFLLISNKLDSFPQQYRLASLALENINVFNKSQNSEVAQQMGDASVCLPTGACSGCVLH